MKMFQPIHIYDKYQVLDWGSRPYHQLLATTLLQTIYEHKNTHTHALNTFFSSINKNILTNQKTRYHSRNNISFFASSFKP